MGPSGIWNRMEQSKDILQQDRKLYPQGQWWQWWWDFDKMITDKVLRGSLEKKSFLVKFLDRKCCELGNRRASQYTLNMDTQAAGRTTFKIRKGEKIYHIRVEDTSEEEEDGETLAEEFEKTLLGQVMNKPAPGAEKKVKKYPPKECPIKCGAKHPNGFVFFCKTFRSKSMDERQTLCKNVSLCVLCLTPKSKSHTCVMRGTKRSLLLCFSQHSPLPTGSRWKPPVCQREGWWWKQGLRNVRCIYASNQCFENLNLVKEQVGGDRILVTRESKPQP